MKLKSISRKIRKPAFTATNCRLIAALRDCFATLAWPSAHFALSLSLRGKLRAKCFALAKRR
ncbi:hypothetical protein EHO58_05515 [Leptospira selangorensis]|nr:hypothetical protein EHO58_05515 [Leptospira selangorensis]